MHSILEVPPATIDRLWPKIMVHMGPVIEKAHGEVTEATTKERIKQGIARLFIVIENNEIIAITTFEMRTFDSGDKALYMPMMGGEKMFEVWGEDMHQIGLDMAKQFGCRELRGICVRDGWLRVLKKKGWKPVHTVMSLEV